MRPLLGRLLVVVSPTIVLACGSDSAKTSSSSAEGAGGGVAGGAGTGGSAGIGGGSAGTGGSSSGTGGSSGKGGALPDLPAATADWTLEGCVRTQPTTMSLAGTCCTDVACYTPGAGEACLDFTSARASGKISLTTGAGSGTCQCSPPGGPYVAPSGVPMKIGAPGQCCYLSAYNYCTGRPLDLGDGPRFAPLASRSDWVAEG